MWLGLMGLATCLHVALPVSAASDMTALSPEERTALRAEIRRFLTDEPEVIGEALTRLNPPSYAEAASTDKALIAEHAEALFAADLTSFGPEDAPGTLALLTDSECTACERAIDDMQALTKVLALRVTLIDNPALVAQFDLDLLPAYVFPDMIVRGHVPPAVIERYVTTR